MKHEVSSLLGLKDCDCFLGDHITPRIVLSPLIGAIHKCLGEDKNAHGKFWLWFV